MRISVLFNTPSDRFLNDPTFKAAEEDTVLSAKEVAGALESKGARVTLHPINEHTIDEVIDGLTSDLVFNLIEWTGVDAPFAVHTFDRMDQCGVRYTGATKQSYMDSCDKTRIKALVTKAGLPTAPWQVFATGNEPVLDGLPYPMLVKVSLEHSSVGIGMDSIVYNKAALRAVVKKRIAEYRQPVFAEMLLTGREFQVTMLDTAQGLRMLPPAEVTYTSGTSVPLLTYESRWDETHSDYANSSVCVASLDAALDKALAKICFAAFTGIGFRDYGRFDIRCDGEGQPYFLELNSNPGLGDDEEYGMTLSYKAAGMTFADFIWEIVQSALRRYSR